ncbi:MAG: hypothetical protein ACLGH3_04430 [Actinomycetota bacterium]
MVVLLCALAVVSPQAASAVDRTAYTCDFRVTEPGFRVISLDLEFETNAISRTLGGTWQAGMAQAEPWYWMAGNFIIKRDTYEIVSFMLSYSANNAPGVVVSQGGLDVRQDTPAVPGKGSAFHYSALAPGLKPGRYLVVFVWLGSTGPSSVGGSNWRTAITSGGLDPSCSNIGVGETYSLDQRRMSGSQIHVPGAGIGSGLTATQTLPRSYIVGEIVAGPGDFDTYLEARTPSGTFSSLRGRLNPVVSRGGTVLNSGRYSGILPQLLHAGVNFDLTS